MNPGFYHLRVVCDFLQRSASEAYKWYGEARIAGKNREIRQEYFVERSALLSAWQSMVEKP